MATITEKQMIDKLSSLWAENYQLILTELHIPIIEDIYYDDFLEGRAYVRIDMAALDQKSDEIIFVEAENGLYTQHPLVYLPFCNRLYLLCPFDDSPYRDEQIEWCKKYGIGILEVLENGTIRETLAARSRPMFPSLNAYIKSRLIKKARKVKKNV